MKKLLISIVIYTICNNLLYAQQNKYYFNRINTDNGLSANHVQCILQDSRGYIWLGTSNGLNRYDGYIITTYKHYEDDSTSISKGSIWCIYEDREQNLWIGTEGGGLNLYLRHNNSFKHYTKAENSLNCINDNNVNALFEDSKGNFWIGTGYGGLNLFDRKTGTFTHFKYNALNKTSISSNAIMCIYEDKQQNLWIGTWGGGLNKFNYPLKTFTKYLFDNKTIVGVKNVVWTIYEDTKNNLWIGTWNSGLLNFNRNAGTFKSYTHNYANKSSISYNVVMSVFEDSEGVFWVGTELNLNIMDRQKGTFSIPVMRGNKPNETLLGASIYSVYEDKQGLLWFATNAQGVNIVSKQKKKFTTYNTDDGLIQNHVISTYEDNNKNLWIGTSENGIIKFNRANSTFSNFKIENAKLKSKFISSICYFNENNLLFSSYNGVYLFNVKSNTISLFFKEYETANTSIYNYKNQFILFVTTSKILKLNLKTSKFENYLNTDTLPSITALCFDNDENLWIGTPNRGIFVRNKLTGKFKNFTANNKLQKTICDNNVTSIAHDNKDNIYIGTVNGLSKYKASTQQFYNYKEKEGLQNSNILGIIIDNNSNAWVSTLEGLSQLNTQTQTFTNYTETDGIPDKAPRLQHKTHKGEIILTGLKGLCIFNPDSILLNNYKPPVIFTDFKLFNKDVAIGANNSPLKKHVSETSEITLSYKQSIFSIYWVALNYCVTDKVKYAFIMEGYEKEWNYVGATRMTTYTNLEPGKYVFRVKASNSDGVWDNIGSSIIFNIRPPFWKTIWFKFILLVLVVTLIFTYISIRIANLRRQKIKLNKLVKERTLELQLANKTLEDQQEEILRQRNFLEVKNTELQQQKDTIESISKQLHESDQKRIQFFVNISHEFRTPLTLIVSPLEKILKSISPTNPLLDTLQLINLNAHRLLRLINQLMDIRKLDTGNMKLQVNEGNVVQFLKNISNSFNSVAAQQHINFVITSSANSLITWFDYDKLEKIIVNLLSNAFKFTPDGGSIKLYISEIKTLENTSLNNDIINKLQANNFTGNHYIEIKVIDTGIGMTNEQVALIFERYYQIDTAKQRTVEGTGIGLNLTKEMIDIHHGTICVETTLGAGSIFTVILPVYKIQYATTEISDKKLAYEYMHLLPFTNGTNIETVIETKTVSDTIILVVEDNKELRSFIRSNLSQYQVIEAANGLEGFEKAVSEIPDLIVSDVMMPQMDGWELCKKVKNNPNTNHIPFILLTAKALEENFIKGLKTGADDYIAKPFSVEIFSLKVRNIIETRAKYKAFIKSIFLNEYAPNAALTPDEQFLQRAKSIVEQNMIEENFDVLRFSNFLAMSERQLYRKIKALTDQTVNDFILSIKLKNAAELLKQKQLTIAEVAFTVGFSNPSYFTKCFKEQYGKTPSEYS